MKQSVLIIFCLFLLSACSAYNRIQTRTQNELKTMRLVQPLQASRLSTEKNFKKSSALRVNAAYRYEEKAETRPVATLDLNGEKLLADSTAFITLDGENILLSSLDGKYLIAENLWVPIIHAQHIQYILKTNQEDLVLRLNEKQKGQLIEFFNKAIKQRDALFPAIPPGKKKW